MRSLPQKSPNDLSYQVFLWNWSSIRGAFTASNLRGKVDINDEHHEKMKVYKSVPTWYYHQFQHSQTILKLFFLRWFIALFAAAYAVAQVRFIYNLNKLESVDMRLMRK